MKVVEVDMEVCDRTPHPRMIKKVLLIASCLSRHGRTDSGKHGWTVVEWEIEEPLAPEVQIQPHTRTQTGH